MYNRYIRTDSGAYTRIPQEEEKASSSSPLKDSSSHKETSSSTVESSCSTERISDGITGFLRHILDQFHLSYVDTGDLLLLILLFLLFREEADEELLAALGLLLIL